MPKIPKHKQVVNPPLDGKLVYPDTQQLYTGEYVRDYRGNYYQGTDASFNTNVLEFIPNNPDTRSEVLDNSHRTPEDSDYEKGTFTRYFVKDRRNNQIIEVDKDRYMLERREKKIYRTIHKLDWIITGMIDDFMFPNGYTYPGVASRNKEIVEAAEKVLPGIGTQVLFNTSQFVKEE